MMWWQHVEAEAGLEFWQDTVGGLESLTLNKWSAIKEWGHSLTGLAFGFGWDTGPEEEWSGFRPASMAKDSFFYKFEVVV